MYTNELRSTLESDEPLIAQLVERWTVVVVKVSIGRWFNSGSTENILAFHKCVKKFKNASLENVQNF